MKQEIEDSEELELSESQIEVYTDETAIFKEELIKQSFAEHLNKSRANELIFTGKQPNGPIGVSDICWNG